MEQDRAYERVMKRITGLSSKLLDEKWRKFPRSLLKVTQRMEQVGSGAADSRDLFARYKQLIESEFPDLMAWEFALAFSKLKHVETDKVLVQATNEAAFVFPIAISQRISGETAPRSGDLKRAHRSRDLKRSVKLVFPKVTVAELMAALEGLETVVPARSTPSIH
jgi:hypothetical protein